MQRQFSLPPISIRQLYDETRITFACKTICVSPTNSLAFRFRPLRQNLPSRKCQICHPLEFDNLSTITSKDSGAIKPNDPHVQTPPSAEQSKRQQVLLKLNYSGEWNNRSLCLLDFERWRRKLFFACSLLIPRRFFFFNSRNAMTYYCYIPVQLPFVSRRCAKSIYIYTYTISIHRRYILL